MYTVSSDIKIPEPFLSKLFIQVIMIQNKETNGWRKKGKHDGE